jgi:hypothetical protein
MRQDAEPEFMMCVGTYPRIRKEKLRLGRILRRDKVPYCGMGQADNSPGSKLISFSFQLLTNPKHLM